MPRGMCARCLASNVECVQIFDGKIKDDPRDRVTIHNYKEGRFICRKCLGDPL